MFIGNQVQPTWQITLPNIILLHITAKNDPNTYNAIH